MNVSYISGFQYISKPSLDEGVIGIPCTRHASAAVVEKGVEAGLSREG